MCVGDCTIFVSQVTVADRREWEMDLVGVYYTELRSQIARAVKREGKGGGAQVAGNVVEEYALEVLLANYQVNVVRIYLVLES